MYCYYIVCNCFKKLIEPSQEAVRVALREAVTVRQQVLEQLATPPMYDSIAKHRQRGGRCSRQFRTYCRHVNLGHTRGVCFA